MMKKVKVIGAGLAGCEAALQLAKYGIETELYEMKPKKFSPAHHSEKFAELVASKNKGMVMKNVMPELKGKADGKLINCISVNKIGEFVMERIPIKEFVEIIEGKYPYKAK